MGRSATESVERVRWGSCTGLLGGKLCTVLAAVGFPGATDTYQVNIRLAADVPSGEQELRLSSGWVAAPGVVKVTVK